MLKLSSHQKKKKRNKQNTRDDANVYIGPTMPSLSLLECERTWPAGNYTRCNVGSNPDREE